ncbi:hypothetical protein NKDENANG_02818 [Candidatus Entotheonellaceae bacterium PAL068K]
MWQTLQGLQHVICDQMQQGGDETFRSRDFRLADNQMLIATYLIEAALRSASQTWLRVRGCGLQPGGLHLVKVRTKGIAVGIESFSHQPVVADLSLTPHSD